MGEQVTNWRKSSASANGETCVEVASADAVLIRDTTDRGGVMLGVSAAAWTRFVESVKR